MKTSNPVLSRFGQAAGHERAAGYAQPGPYGQPGYPQQYQPHPQYATGQAYPVTPVTEAPMTLDDVVVKTVTMLAILGGAAAATWILVPDQLLGAAWLGGAVIGLVLGLIISFSRVANPALVVAYSIIEGVFVGAVSKTFESFYDGIVLQAVVGTFGVFFVMTMLYRARVIRATPKFAKVMVAIMGGLFATMLINLVLSLFGVNTHLRDGSGLAIVFSLVCIVVASLSFVLNFANIEEGVRAGVPQRYAWTAAFGIVVGLVWLYLEVLRLLSYLQGDD
ncbi:Bax inhibitor-1/YccA family protein [Micromonospora sp. NPDC093277]|uniref:Bax inhibitor-1/YccA family protein n=1 Tax=Micromonospora sp. NPDC093277 TaxID=3364291 RepID=UPI003821B89A